MKLVVLGAGESGVGSAILARAHGYEVFVSDFGKIASKFKNMLDEQGIVWEEEKHTEELILSASLIVKSPGIPDKVAIIKKAKEKGIRIVSEIEFAFTFNSDLPIAITGSNGKTTTTMLTHYLLKEGGLDVGLAGNIGDSYAGQVAVDPDKRYVLELSSFQLDGIETFRPHIAVITNISPDHLDRYEYKYENYIEAKFRITMNQTSEDYLIYDADDVEIEKWLSSHEISAQKIPFSLNKKFDIGAYVEDQKIIINMNSEKVAVSVEDIALEGKHNVKNAMAATTVAQLMKIRKQTIRESLSSFQGVEHRLEQVSKINNVQYINDSKATNINATFYALDSMKNATVWIVGGVDKGNDYDELMPLVREKVKGIICLGVDNRKIQAAYSGVVDTIIETQSMVEAVKIAEKMAEQGDNVLLSPACASFDLFESYEDRGRQFKDAVRNL